MTITKTIDIVSLRYTAETDTAKGHPITEPHALWVECHILLTSDDPSDVHFPVRKYHTYRLYQDSDVRNEPELVQDLWNVIFTKHQKVSPDFIPKVGPDNKSLYVNPTPQSTATLQVVVNV
jgi:hypothetical protein